MLATSDQVRAYMGNIKLTPAQEDHLATVILPGVQSGLEIYCNRPLEPVHIREFRSPDDRGYVVFTKTPVWKVYGIYNANTGEPVTLPTPPTGSSAIPDFTNIPNVRNMNNVDPTQPVALPYEYFVGITNQSPYWPMTYPIVTGSDQVTYVCDYIGGWQGAQEEGLVLDIIRVAAREAERQFDDATSTRGGAQDAAQSSDPRSKGWTDDELEKWDRLRRRTTV